MEKSDRLSFISSLLNGYDKVLEIGTDHGLILKYAFDNSYIKEAIAADLREKPLISAKKNLKNYPCMFKISNGFQNITETFDCCVIAGMGAHLISEILRKAPSSNAHYILGTNDKEEELRSFLENNNFRIIDEYIIFDKFYYLFIKAIKTSVKHKLSNEDLLLGPILKTKQVALEYYEKKKLYLEDLLKKVDSKKALKIKEKLSYYQKVKF